VVIWYIFPGIGIFYQEKSGNPGPRQASSACLGIIDTQPIPALGDAILSPVMQFYLWRCDFIFGDAILSVAMRFYLWRCNFSLCDAIF
jgi:hypothetical protein